VNRLAAAFVTALLLVSCETPLRSAQATIDSCAIVKQTPDGFLNMREFPYGHAKIIRRLKPGAYLDVSTGSCSTKDGVQVCNENNSWTAVINIPFVKKTKGYPQGWVASRFIRFIDCED
jgi:hypothetical protein